MPEGSSWNHYYHQAPRVTDAGSLKGACEELVEGMNELVET